MKFKAWVITTDNGRIYIAKCQTALTARNLFNARFPELVIASIVEAEGYVK